MPPFTPSHVARYLLWIALVLVAVIVLAWYLLETPAHEPIQPKRSGNTAQLQIPSPAPRAAAVS